MKRTIAILTILVLLSLIGTNSSSALDVYPIPYGWQTVSEMQYIHHAAGIVSQNGFAYVIGGYDGVDVSSTVEYAPMLPNGNIGPWVVTSSLNTPSYSSAAVVAQNHVYLIGGHDVLTAVWSNSVQVAYIQADGSLGEWHQTSRMILPRDNHAAVNIGNYIYAIGGSPWWWDQSSVEYAEIYPDGELGSWQYTTSMNQVRKAVAAVAYGNCIYAIGGGTGDLSNSTNTVERACANPDGTLGSWEYMASMNTARSYAAPVVWENKLIVLGGVASGISLDSVEVAEIDPDGDLGVWQEAEPLQYPRHGGGSVASDQYIYILGGYLEYYPIFTKIVDRASLIVNSPPLIGEITAPIDPIPVNTLTEVSATFTDPDVQDTHTAVWNWGDGTTSAGLVVEADGSGTVSGSHTYSAAGVYTLCLTLSDPYEASDARTYEYIVAFNPDGGFVTGGGWLISPEGAYLADPTLTGRANFGFVSRYQKGSTLPTGNTVFQFKMANLTFHSDAYEWLVIAGAKAQFKGVGTINQEGSYKFLITAIDGQVIGGGGVDKFRIKIWYEDADGEHIVYDNQLGASIYDEPTTAIEGGSIVIHK